MEVRRFMRAHSMMTLRKDMRNCFVDDSHKDAFDLLYREAWRPEEVAMGNSTLPTVLDKLCMVANINTRKLIEQIKDFHSQFILNYGQKKIGSEDGECPLTATLKNMMIWPRNFRTDIENIVISGDIPSN